MKNPFIWIKQVIIVAIIINLHTQIIHSQINSNSMNTIELSPSIVSISADRLALIYQSVDISFSSNLIANTNYSIRGDLKDVSNLSTVSTLKSNIILSDNKATNKIKPSADLLSDGNIVIVYLDATNNDIYMLKVSNNLLVLVSDTIVNLSSGVYRNNPKVAVIDSNKFLIIWECQTNLSSAKTSIYGRIYNNDMSDVKQFIIITFVSAESAKVNLTLLNNRNIVITWNEQSRNINSYYSVFYVIMDQSGNTIGSAFDVSASQKAEDDKEPFIITLSNGGFLISWTKYISTAVADIYARVFDASGTALGLPFLVFTNSKNVHFNSSSVALTNAAFLIFWNEYVESGVTATTDASSMKTMFVAYNGDLTIRAKEDILFQMDFSETLLWTRADQSLGCSENTFYKVRSSSFTTLQKVEGDASQCSLWSSSIPTCLPSEILQDIPNGDAFCDYYNGECNDANRNYPYEKIGEDFFLNIAYIIINNSETCAYQKLDLIMEKKSAQTSDALANTSPNVKSFILPISLLGNYLIFHVANPGYKFCPQNSYSASRICCSMNTNHFYRCCSSKSILNTYVNPYYQTRYNCYTTIKNKFQYSPTIKKMKNNFYIISASLPYINSNISNIKIKSEKIHFTFFDFDNLINDTYKNSQDRPKVAALSNGNYLIVWQSNQTDFYAIFYKIIDENKITIKAETQISQNASENFYYPKILVFKNKFFILWMKTSGCSAIRGAVAYDNGIIAIPDFSLIPCDTTIYGNIIDFNVSKLPDDKFIICFSQNGSKNDIGSDVYFIIYNSDITIYYNISKINLKNFTGDQYNISMKLLEKNGVIKYVATWESNAGEDGSAQTILAKIYDANFKILKDEFIVNSTTLNNQYSPNLLIFPTSNFLIAYSSNQGEKASIFAQLFDNSGMNIGSEITIASTTNGSLNLTDTIMSKDDNIFFTWNGYSTKDSNGIAVAKFDLMLNKIWECYPNRFKYNAQTNSFFGISTKNQLQLALVWNSNADGDSSITLEFMNNCPNKFYTDSLNDFICSPCSEKCLLGCSGSADNCLFSCDASCSSCSSDRFNCITCSDGYFPLVDNPLSCKKADALVIGYFLNSAAKRFDKCDSQCWECSNTSTSCTVCNEQAGYFAYDFNGTINCINKMTDGYAFNTLKGTAARCDVSCLTCSTQTNCKACTTGYVPTVDSALTCISKGLLIYSNPSLNKYYFYSSISDKYEICDVSCLDCKTSSLNCLNCNIAGGYYPQEDDPNTCKSVAPAGFYLNKSNQMYVKCDLSCKTCTDSAKNCTACNTSYYPLIDNQNSCNNSTPEGYYFVENKYAKCDISCKTCDSTATNCLSCNTNYYKMDSQPNTCINTIPANSYVDKISKLIQTCGISCKECINSQDSCTECNFDKLYFPLETDSSKCYVDCPDFYWKNFLKRSCSLCDKSCIKCKDSTPACVECAPNYYPKSDDANACFKDAPGSNYVFDSANAYWYLCPFPGLVCNPDKSFQACVEGFFLLPEKKDCIKACPQGYYPNSATNACEECLKPCQICGSNKICLACIDNFFLDTINNTCNKSCPVGTYPDIEKKTCMKCELSCFECENAITCNSCIEGFYYYRDKKACLMTCSEGYYIPPDSKNCEKCSDICKTCSDSSTKCDTCGKDSYFDKFSKSCVATCPKGFYADIASNTCSACHLSCLTCKGNNDVDCLSCDISRHLVLNQGYCVNKCSESVSKVDSSCLNIVDCFDYILLNIPKIFFIQEQRFKGSLAYNLKESCRNLKNDLNLNWKPIQGAVFSSNDSQFELDVSNITEGSLEFAVEILYQSSSILLIKKSTTFITPLLVPLLMSEKLEFYYGNDITIDASLSYDQGSKLSLASKEDVSIDYTWSCGAELRSLCENAKGSVLIIEFKNYSSVISNPEKLLIIEMEFRISKDKRKANKQFQIKLNKTLATGSVEKENNSENKIQSMQDISELIQINQLTKNKNNEIIFSASFNDKNYHIFLYNFLWTIEHFKLNSQYLNSRKEALIKVLSDDLLIGENNISLQIIDPGNLKTYEKKFIYEKPRPPYGGNCQVIPSVGFSIETNFVFKTNGWISKSVQLFYRIKYLNNQKIYYDISNGAFTDQEYSTSLLPVADNFILEISDSIGLKSTASCVVKVKRNPNLADLEYYLQNEFDPYKKLLLVDVYKSNIKAQSLSGFVKNGIVSDEAINNIADATMNNKVLDMLDALIKNSNEMEDQLERIISMVLDISAKNFDRNKMQILNNSISQIVKNIDPYLEYIDKLKNVYQILSNLLEKVSSDGEFKKEKKLEIELQGHLNTINSKLFTQVVDGQQILVQNENYNIQLNRVSSINLGGLNMAYDTLSFSDENSKRRKETKILLRSLSTQNPCDDTSAICIPINNISSIMNITNSKSVGFQAQLNNKQNLPINEMQFSNSLEFQLSTQDSTGKTRILTEAEFHIHFEIRLKIPVTKNNSVINQATCVQYINSRADTSCESWYDLDTNEVICSCLKQGLTVNILDETLANFSKLSQFPNLASGLMNPYSITIVSSLITAFFLTYLVAHYKDSKDYKILRYKNHPSYDLMQHYIIKFRNEKFGIKVKFWQLYIYLIKNLHPILSIFNLYDPIYNRSVRVMDFYLDIYLTFFFTVLPLYFSENKELTDLLSQRSIQNRNKTVNDLGIKIYQIIQSFIFSIISSLLTMIIKHALRSVFYADINLKESLYYKLYSRKTLTLKCQHVNSNYFNKLKRALWKIKYIFIFIKNRLPLKQSGNGISNVIGVKTDFTENSSTDKMIKLESDIQNNASNKVRKKNDSELNNNNNNKYARISSDFKLNKIDNLNLTDLTEHKLLNFLNIDNLEAFAEQKYQDSIDGKLHVSNINKQDNIYQNSFLLIKSKKSSKFEKSDFPFSMTNQKQNNLLDSCLITNKNIDSFSAFNNSLNNTIKEAKKGISNVEHLLLFKKAQKYGLEQFQINFASSKPVKRKPKYFFLNHERRKFSLAESTSDITCEVISIVPLRPVSFYFMKARVYIKIIIIFLLYAILLLLISVMIHGIYKKYGTNIIKICFMPLVTMLVTKLIFVINFFIFIQTLILYYKGKYYLNSLKREFFKNVIFRFFLSPLALNHYDAILSYNSVFSNKI